MNDESARLGGSPGSSTTPPSLPPAVGRAAFQAELDRLRIREKAHTHEGDAIAAARRRLPMVEVDPGRALVAEPEIPRISRGAALSADRGRR
jgi:hypothetical protein